jgi:tryptophan synthase alpha subunit
LGVDGVICGSALVEKIEQNVKHKARLLSSVLSLARRLARALRP